MNKRMTDVETEAHSGAPGVFPHPNANPNPTGGEKLPERRT